MALLACPECGKQFSDAAPACPRCGVPFAEAVRSAETPPGEADMPPLPIARVAPTPGAAGRSGGARPASARRPEGPAPHPMLRGVTAVAGAIAMLMGLGTFVLGVVLLSWPTPARGGSRVTVEDIETLATIRRVTEYLALVTGASFAVAIGGTALLVAEMAGERR